MNSGWITESYATMDITLPAGTNQQAGGLVGKIDCSSSQATQCEVRYCWAGGSATSDGTLGGLVGDLSTGYVRYSYSITQLSQGNGLIGKGPFGTTTQYAPKNYWDMEVTGTTTDFFSPTDFPGKPRQKCWMKMR